MYTEEQVNKLSAKEVDKLFRHYKMKLSSKMVKSLGKLIIRIYLMGVYAASGIRNQYTLSEDLDSGHFLNSALQSFTCKLYYRFCLFLVPLSVGIIMSRHYLSQQNPTDARNGRRTNEGDDASN